MDMSLSEAERSRRAAFYQKKREMISKNQIVFDCESCLILFTDVILYRMHISMHSTSPPPIPNLPTPVTSATWQCSMCRRQYSNRLEFQIHTVKYGHSLIPQGIFIPPSLVYSYGLPDLSSLCQSNDLLKELANIVKTNITKNATKNS
uniref:C2H2-type domain-containing protein n=1 Tax=Caenorhabditis tropicalis TaxID=1561998 RepID=A0A1I7U472_9PELO